MAKQTSKKTGKKSAKQSAKKSAKKSAQAVKARGCAQVIKAIEGIQKSRKGRVKKLIAKAGAKVAGRKVKSKQRVDSLGVPIPTRSQRRLMASWAPSQSSSGGSSFGGGYGT